MRPVELSPFWGRAMVFALWRMPRWSYRYIGLETGRIGLDPCHTFTVTWKGRRIPFAFSPYSETTP